MRETQPVVLPAPALRALLILVRRRIRQLERRAHKPTQQAKVAALTAAGRQDAAAWALEQMKELEDGLCQALASPGRDPDAQDKSA